MSAKEIRRDLDRRSTDKQAEVTVRMSREEKAALKFNAQLYGTTVNELCLERLSNVLVEHHNA